jgi:DNA-binding response OmpR family regulator
MSRIFLVEYDPAVAGLLQEFLSGRGDEVILCERNDEADLITAREASIVVGIVEARARGLSIAMVLKQRCIPFLLISASIAPEPLTNFRLNPILVRPFSLSALATQLQRLLNP